MAHFHLGLPLAHNHPPLRSSAKIPKTPEYPFTTGQEKAICSWYADNPCAVGISRNSPVISRHDLSRSRVGREGGRKKIRRCRLKRRSERQAKREKDETSARSRATIADHLPSSTGLLVLDPRRRRRGRNVPSVATLAGVAPAAAIIKLFTHTVRHLSSASAILTCYYLILTLLAI